MNITLVHGWSFDSAFWAELIARLPGFRCTAAERGYFSEPRISADPATLAIGHSFGGLLLLEALPPGSRGLIVINGFDRFAAGDDAHGVAPRLLDRMIARFADQPQAVLADFRRRCGAPPPPAILHADRLASDLRLLRNADARAASAALDIPVLLLDGACDPILSAEHRAAAFAHAPDVERATCADGAHLLPLTHPAWCAERIRAFAERLA